MALNPSSSGANIEFIDNSCLEFFKTGSGTKLDPTLIGAIIKTDGTSIKCTDDGLSACITIVAGQDGQDGQDGNSGNNGNTGNDGEDGTIVISSNPSDCLNIILSGDGSPGNPVGVTGALTLSPLASNTLVCTTDGLLSVVDIDVQSLSPCLDVSIDGNGTNANPYLISQELVLDQCLDNLAVCGEDGLYVPLEYKFENGPGICMDVSGYGTCADPLCFDVSIKKSCAEHNAITLAVDGIFSPTYHLYSNNSSCIAIDVNGSGEYQNPWVMTPELILSSAEDNQLRCTTSGLYVSPDTIIGGPSDCSRINISGLGTAVDPRVISSEIVVRPHVDNIVKCHPDGLFVEGTGNYVFKDSGPISWEVIGSGTVSDPKIVCPTLNITNVVGGDDGCDPGNGLLVLTENGLEVRPTFIEVSDACLGTGAWVE